MEKEDRSISMARANVYSLYFVVPVTILFFGIYIMLWGGRNTADQARVVLDQSWLMLGMLIGGIIVHELIHGFTWIIAARKPFSAIKFGFQLKTFTPYAHCREPMAVQPYRLGALMPGLLLGILPGIYGMASGEFGVFLFGYFFTVAAGGDALILWLLRGVGADKQVLDHPERAGCYVITNE